MDQVAGAQGSVATPPKQRTHRQQEQNEKIYTNDWGSKAQAWAFSQFLISPRLPLSPVGGLGQPRNANALQEPSPPTINSGWLGPTNQLYNPDLVIMVFLTPRSSQIKSKGLNPGTALQTGQNKVQAAATSSTCLSLVLIPHHHGAGLEPSRRVVQPDLIPYHHGSGLDLGCLRLRPGQALMTHAKFKAQHKAQST